ncbi:MAG: PIN domain-containing protein [Actinomycetota bacterium]|nr:PIN domain-containing protein [Actinomycetota bacterium]
MELADTSAWTNREKNPELRTAFDALVEVGEIATCAMVRLELLWTARDLDAFVALRERLDALLYVPIGEPVWERATDIFGLLASRGPLHHRQVKLPDLLIAAAAELAALPLLHYDRDFEVIAGVTGQPLRAIAPLGSL